MLKNRAAVEQEWRGYLRGESYAKTKTDPP
jgi:hypothetical protein